MEGFQYLFGQLMKACNYKELLMPKGSHRISIDEWKGGHW